MSQRRILAIAYACNPYKGSEEGVGWGWVTALRDCHVAVVAAEYHREDIERERAREPERYRNLEFHFVPAKPWHYRPTKRWRAIETSLLKPVMNLVYHAWQGDALRLARRLHAEAPFDLVHLITYVGFRFPGRFFRLGIPFVWGPIGGLENTPWRFLPSLGPKGCVYYLARNVVNTVQRLVLPGPRLALKRAGKGVIAATSSIQREIRRTYGVPSTVISEVGMTDLVVAASNPEGRNADEPLRLVWSGNHLPGKALPFLLEALRRLDSGVRWNLDILGDGPMTESWRQLAERLGQSTRCRWHGRLSRSEALGVMAKGDVFVITSVYDLTSTVVVEALATGLPVICPDAFGFQDAVDETCGIRVPLRTVSIFVDGLAAAVLRIATDEVLRRRLAAGTREKARDYLWTTKAGQIASVYRSALADWRGSD